MAFSKASQGNCLPYALSPRCFHASQEDKYRDKNKKYLKFAFKKFGLVTGSYNKKTRQEDTARSLQNVTYETRI